MPKKKRSSPSYDVFISYSHRDRLIADRLCKALDDQGISYYIDHKSQKQQNELPKGLVDAITGSKTLLFMASQNSYESPFAVKELVFAFNHIPIERIIVYKIDTAPLPANIGFVTRNKNIVEAHDDFVREELITRLCKLLERNVKKVDWDKYQQFSWLETETNFYAFLAVLCLLCIGVSVGAGLLFQSLVIGIGAGIGMVGIGVTLLFSLVFWSDYLHQTKVGKLAYLLTSLLGMAGSLMMPVSAWMGIEAQSWGTGLLWAAGSWIAVILLMVIVNNATSGISIRRAPLTVKRRWGRIYDIFLCYNKKDEQVVQHIRTELLRNGLTFLESNSSNAKQAVEACRGFLYIASQNSYQDKLCDQQLAYGFNHRRPIIAYAVDQAGMPKDKKMAFSNSNILTEKTHPIETKLMTDLKTILTESGQGVVKISETFWRSVMVSFLYTAGIVSVFVASYLLKSLAVGITIALNILVTWSYIYDARDKRKNYVKGESLEIIAIECLLIILSIAVPVLVWWLLNPGWVLSALLVFIVFFIQISIGETYEYAAKTSPTGRLSPNETQQYFDVFISYSRKDTAMADEVCGMLDRNGISYFIDRQGIPGGSEFPTILAQAIQNCALVLFLISENSVNSKFCRQEMTYTEAHKKAGERMFFYIGFDKDTLRQFLADDETKKKALEKETLMAMSDDWKEQLRSHLKNMIPHTRNGANRLTQKQGQSWMVLMKDFVVKSIKGNPLTSITLIVLTLAYVVGSFLHSWEVGLGIYSLLEPILYYAVSRKYEDAVTLTGVFITFGVTVGMLTHSVWWGISAGFVTMIHAFIKGDAEDEAV